MIYLKYILHANENDTIFVRSIQVSLHIIKFTIDNYEFLFSRISRCAVYPWILHSFFTAIWRQTEFISRMNRRRKVRTRKLLLSLYGKAAVIRITPRGKRQFNAGFVTVATVVLLASVLLTRRKIKFLPVTRLGAACFIAIRFKEIPGWGGFYPTKFTWLISFEFSCSLAENSGSVASSSWVARDCKS